MAEPEAPAAIALLREKIRALVPGGGGIRGAVCPLGLPAVDAVLPWGGLPRGVLHEVAGGAGDGAAVGFAAALAGRLAGAGGVLLWCRSRAARQESGLPHGPGLAAFGLAAARLILVEAKRPAEVLWAMEEGLRSAALAVVVGEAAAADLSASRRLQLAAEACGATALLLRIGQRGGASAALTRWHIAAEPGGLLRPAWQVRLLRCRGGMPKGGDGAAAWRLEWDEQALSFRLAAALAGQSPAARVA
jgi:protein ImuA